AGKRTRGEDDLVLGTERVAGGVDLLVQVTGAEPAPADILARPLHVQRLFLERAGSQVYAEELAGPAVGHGYGSPPSSPGRAKNGKRKAAKVGRLKSRSPFYDFRSPPYRCAPSTRSAPLQRTRGR